MKLQNILKAFTKRNFSIGYCQGFNIIVGALLQRFPNEVNIKLKLGRCFLDLYTVNRELSSS